MESPKLTPTSYAILAHLAVQPWSAYELARQMTRGLDLVWPRAQSAMYEEPKKLVARGLARAAKEPFGTRRSRTVYSITPKGRRALRAWLGTEPAPPQLESEALLRVFFAEHGSKEALADNVRTLEAYASGVRERLVAQISGYLADGGPFPDRWHVIALGARFLLEYEAAIERWSAWAEEQIEDWESASAGPGREMLQLVLRDFDRLT